MQLLKNAQKPLSFLTKLIVSFCILLVSCQSGKDAKENKGTDTMTMDQESSHMIDRLLVDNKKDPSCGMPVTAGISDTTNYKGHVLGFCSKECMADFLKNPEAQIAAADLKK